MVPLGPLAIVMTPIALLDPMLQTLVVRLTDTSSAPRGMFDVGPRLGPLLHTLVVRLPGLPLAPH